jgi:hypothetical protein
LRLQHEPDFAEFTPRQQGKRYTENAGTGIFASLMQLACLGKLNIESARKIVKEPDTAKKLLGNKH